MTDPSDLTSKRPPAAAFGDEAIRGTRCQDQHTLDGKVVPARHDGCPGWWAGLGDDPGFSCGCECHETIGWSGWTQHRARYQG